MMEGVEGRRVRGVGEGSRAADREERAKRG
jgi:hypothetical protein